MCYCIYCHVHGWKKFQSFIRTERFLVDTTSAGSNSIAYCQQKIIKRNPGFKNGIFFYPFESIFANMKAVIQRVSQTSVTINSAVFAEIKAGLLVLIGIEDADNMEDIEWLSNKIVNLRIFDDENKVPNISVKDMDGDILLVSQFTLHASTKKGNRPSYIKASKPEIAIPIYEKMIAQLEFNLGKKIFTGEFGADMKVLLLNDGPVTICIDSKNKE